MILSQTAVYALKAALHLAETPGDEPVPVDQIAEALDVPRNYLSKILHVLAREGLLTSTRGPRGGFRLSGGPADIYLSAVIRPFDEIATASGCLLGRARCSDADPCAAHARWKEISAQVRTFLIETTLADLTNTGAGLSGLSAG